MDIIEQSFFCLIKVDGPMEQKSMKENGPWSPRLGWMDRVSFRLLVIFEQVAGHLNKTVV